MKHKNMIIKLYNQGKSYSEISKILGCGKGIISYHCGDGQKQKSYIRNIKCKNRHPYINKIYSFNIRYKSNVKKNNLIKSSIRKLLISKIYDFNKGFQMSDKSVTLEQVIEKFGEQPKCYLTGVDIDINKPNTYQFDHVIPVSRGGTNTIDNLQICTKQANESKRDMNPEEFINLCKQILIHHGYSISKAEENGS